MKPLEFECEYCHAPFPANLMMFYDVRFTHEWNCEWRLKETKEGSRLLACSACQMLQANLTVITVEKKLNEVVCEDSTKPVTASPSPE